MANVTDASFRRLIAKYGKPDVMYTEFVSANGLCSIGRDALLVDLKYSKTERPIVAQLFTADPKKMYEAAKLIAKLKFDGLDINMGCPDKNVVKQQAGAYLIKTPDVAQQLIRAAKKGARQLPISVKTRIGDTKNELKNWLPVLLVEKPAAIIVHARTRKEMSRVSAHWETVAEAVQIAKGSGVLIVGNGDVENLAEARAKAKETGCDGIMIGRGVFGNPWLFSDKIPAPREKLKALLEHTKLFTKLLGKDKPFLIMRKHYKAYASGFDGAKELRVQLMETKNIADVEQIIKNFKF